MRLKYLYKYLKPPRGFRLTKAGNIFFVFLFAIILVAMLTGNNLLFLILSCMLSFMIISGFESERNLRHIEIERLLPGEIYANEQTKIGYLIRNTKNSSYRLVLSDIHDLKVSSLYKGKIESIRNEVVFPQRGTVNLTEIKIFTTYPYGLFEKSITFDTDDALVVFPEPVPYTSFLSSGNLGSGKGKDYDSISHVRAYIPGDAFSNIVWKKQHLGLLTRVVEGGSGMKGIVVLVPGADTEQKLKFATFVICEMFQRQYTFGLCLNTFFSGLENTKAHKLMILKQLAQVSEIREPSYKLFNGDEQIIYI